MKKLVITVLVLAGLLLVADFAAAAAAEYRLSQRLRSELELTEDPAVRIHGFPFLTQAVSGQYDRIEMSAKGLDVGPLNSVAVEATMRDVTAPILEIWTGDLGGVRIDRVQGRVRIGETDLGQVIGLDDLQVEPATGRLSRGVRAPAQDRAVARMSASTDIAGQRVEVIVIALLDLVDDTVAVRPLDVRLGVAQFGQFGLPEIFRKPVLSRFAVQVDPGGLPFAVTPTEVRVADGSIIVQGSASDITVREARLSRR